MNKSYSSPNRMVWEFFGALRRLSKRIQHYENENEIKQDTALCVILAVNGVEIFMNVYFRVFISEMRYSDSYDRVMSDLKKKANLEIKIKEWPDIVFGQTINFGSGIGQKFTWLKKQRNKLTHFLSSHETLELPNIAINGVADTSIYDSMTKETALQALEIAEQFICEVFRLRGINAKEIKGNLHFWTGRVPM